MNPPRLCIDGRIASERDFRGLLAREWIDEIIREASLASGWAPPKTSVFLLSPGEKLSIFKRIDSRFKTARTPIHWWLEKRLLKKTDSGIVHRFRPVDRMTPYPDCPSVTVVLPPQHKLPFALSRREKHEYLVPSLADARLLTEQYGIAEEKIAVIRPTPRRFIHAEETPRASSGGYLLFLAGAGDTDRKRLYKVIAERFPTLPNKIVKLSNRTDLSPRAWMKLLQKTQICFYLNAPPFDWATLALESIRLGIPTIFPDANSALHERFPGSSLRLSRFLVEGADLPELHGHARAAQQTLFRSEPLGPNTLADQIKRLYERLGSPGETFTSETLPSPSPEDYETLVLSPGADNSH